MRRVTACLVMVVWGLHAFFALQVQGATPGQETVQERVHQGNALFLKGDLEEALRHYQEALKEASGLDQAKIHYDLANTYTQLGRFEEAKKAYREALRLDPKDEDTKVNLEVTYLAEEGKTGILRPQKEIGGVSESLDQEILYLLQVLEQREFDLPRGTPQPPQPTPPQSDKPKGKDW